MSAETRRFSSILALMDEVTENFDDFGLAPPVLRGLARAGFTTPTPVQRAVIPLALDGVDVLAAATTGSGKTAAFLLPMMQRLLEHSAPRSATRALILVPTRELAQQTEEQFLRLGSYTRLGLGVIIGGVPRSHQIPTLRKNPELLVATPGRLLDHLRAGEVDLSDLECLVLDEADRMLELGFAEDVLALVAASRTGRQSLLFSATLHQRRLHELIGPLLNDPRVVQVDAPRTAPAQMTHQFIRHDSAEQKQAQLLQLLTSEPEGQVLVFVNRRERTLALAQVLRLGALRVAPLHGALDQPERDRVLRLFRQGRVRVLVATEVAARGLDIPDVDLVVHDTPPLRGDDYLHRSGRTGRAGAPGRVVTLVSAADWHRLDRIRRYLHLDIEEHVLPGLKATRFRIPPKRAKSSTTKPGAVRRAKVKQRWRDRGQTKRGQRPDHGP